MNNLWTFLGFKTTTKSSLQLSKVKRVNWKEILFVHSLSLSVFQVSALFSVWWVQTLESSGRQRLKERQRETQHPDQDSAAPTDQRPEGLHRETTGRGLLSLYVFVYNWFVDWFKHHHHTLTWSWLKCFRCLFLIGPARCINSNCPRMNRRCMMWSLPNPGNNNLSYLLNLRKDLCKNRSHIRSIGHSFDPMRLKFGVDVFTCSSVQHRIVIILTRVFL